MTNLKLSLRPILAAVAGVGIAVVCASSAQAENRGGTHPVSNAPQFSCSVFQGKAGWMAAVTLTSGTASQVADIDVTVVTPGGPVQTAMCGLAFSGSKTNNAPFTPKGSPSSSYIFTCSAHQATTNEMCRKSF
jgi:predicted Zn-dependent protease